jgi:hypothetical protein
MTTLADEHSSLADEARKMLLEDAEDGTDDYMQALDTQAQEKAYKDAMRYHTAQVAEIYKNGQVPSIRDGLHVSDVFHRKFLCWRKMVFLALYKQDSVIHSATLSARFETGNAIHARWQGNVGRAVTNHHIEYQHLETFWRLLFTPDIIADYLWPDALVPEPTIWELKGYNSAEYGRLTRKGKLPVDAILQCTLYMWFTGIHRGLVVVENKDTQAFSVWPVEYNEELVMPLVPTFDHIKADVDAHLENPDVLPDRLAECTAPDAEIPSSCAGCTACFSNPAERIQLRRKIAWE